MGLQALGANSSSSVSAPGRVNLIGEHIDYCDLAVLPMAIQRDVRIDFTPRTDARIRIANTDPVHGFAEFEVATAIPSAPQGHWSNYVRAAVQVSSGRLRPSVAVSAETVDVTVQYDQPTDVPLIGALVGDVSLRGHAVMRRELDPR